MYLGYIFYTDEITGEASRLCRGGAIVPREDDVHECCAPMAFRFFLSFPCFKMCSFYTVLVLDLWLLSVWSSHGINIMSSLSINVNQLQAKSPQKENNTVSETIQNSAISQVEHIILYAQWSFLAQ